MAIILADVSIPYPANWRSVAYGNGIFCALVSDGTSYATTRTAATSVDGRVWATHEMPFAASGAYRWRAIAWNDSVFCAVATAYGSVGARSATSPDGVNWTLGPAFSTAPNNVESMAWNGSVFCFISVYPHIAYASPDGLTWTQTSFATAIPRNIASNGTIFCAVGMSSGVMTSPDGVVWTTRTMPAGLYPSQLVWAGTFFCTRGQAETIVSPDGINWTAYAQPASFGSLVWNGSLISAVGFPTLTNTSYYTSTNGITWVGGTTSALIHTGVGAAGAGVIVRVMFNDVIDSGSVSGSWYAHRSTNGTTWDRVDLTTQGPIEAVAKVGNFYHAIGYCSNAAISTDGRNWVPDGRLSGPTGTGVYASIGGTAVCVIAVYYGVIFRRTGAGTWIEVPFASALYDAFSVAASDTRVCVIGNNSYTTLDGLAWTETALPASASHYDIEWGSGLFVAVTDASNNCVSTSPDGVTWTPRAFPAGTGLTSVAWNGTRFCAEGYTASESASFSSVNGVTWSAPLALSNITSNVVSLAGVFYDIAATAFGAPLLLYASTGETPWVASGPVLPFIMFVKIRVAGSLMFVSQRNTWRIQTRLVNPVGFFWTGFINSQET